MLFILDSKIHDCVLSLNSKNPDPVIDKKNYRFENVKKNTDQPDNKWVK